MVRNRRTKPSKTQKGTKPTSSSSGRDTSSNNCQNIRVRQVGTSMGNMNGHSERERISITKKYEILNLFFVIMAYMLYLISVYRLVADLFVFVWPTDIKLNDRYKYDVKKQIALGLMISWTNCFGLYILNNKNVYRSAIGFGIVALGCLVHWYHQLYNFKNWGYVLAFERIMRDLSQ